jgi:predicted MFS family arabinose efflux permease
MAAADRRRTLGVAAALALATAVSLGLGRFSYALLLPPMRADLGWSYLTAGAMNTANAAGYLLGALLLPRTLARVDARRVLLVGSAGTALMLAAHGLVLGRDALLLLRALAGMATGFGVTLLLMFGTLTGMIGLAPVMAAAIGGPANFLVLVLISEAAPLKTRRALEVVRDLRLPGGEATYDREMRLQRRKRATTAL